MLEDKITGPIYKTVHNDDSYSVSQINIFVNWFVIGIWSILLLRYFIFNLFCEPCCLIHGDLIVLITSILTAVIIIGMLEDGKTKFTDPESEDISFFTRQANYKDDAKIDELNEKERSKDK